MYSTKIIAAKAAQLEAAFPLKLKEYSVEEIEYWVDRLKQLIHPDSTENKPRLVRDLHEDEQNFIANEIAMTKISYPYWAPRYAFIKYDKGGVRRLRFAESQEMLLSVLATLEESGKPAKILNLKARQVFSSTFSETVITHKVMNTAGITSVVASDEPNKSEFMFNMMERIYDNLPFYLKPHKKFRVKGSQLYFDKLDSLIDVDSGNKKVGGIGQGMAQPLDSLIVTPTGFVKFGELDINDEIIGVDGKPHLVTNIYPQGLLDTYRVTFSDSTSAECCEDHLWRVLSAKDRNRKRNGKVLPLKEISKNLHGKRGQANYFIPISKTVEFKEVNLPFDAYLMGVLLGDGGLTTKSCVKFTAGTEELVGRVKEVLPKNLKVRYLSKFDYAITSTDRNNTVLRGLQELKIHGLGSKEKYIPDLYKYSSIKDREALIQGLLDTDGSITNNSIDFYSTAERLADDFIEVVQSLGGIANKKKRNYDNKGWIKSKGIIFVVRVIPSKEFMPFRISRKANKYKGRVKYPPTRSIKAVEYVGKKNMQCILVDAPDSLYLTNSYIVTHNTIHSGHLSELATWNNTSQITADLLPAVMSGESTNTFFIIESTANGKHGALYEWWKAAKRKKFYGFVPVFIPWWIMTEKYATEPEDGWGPSDRVTKLMLQIKQTKGIQLNRKQMFWWDTNYASYKEGDKLHEFFAEYASDDQEAFQLAGKTVFDTEKLNDMLRRAKTWPMGVYQVEERLAIK